MWRYYYWLVKRNRKERQERRASKLKNRSALLDRIAPEGYQDKTGFHYGKMPR